LSRFEEVVRKLNSQTSVTGQFNGQTSTLKLTENNSSSQIAGWEGRFNPRSRHITTKLRETAQRMSDTLQLVVDSSNTQPGRNYVINVDTHSGEVECWGRRRQAEAYRTFVEQCLGARVLCSLSGGKPPFLTCNSCELELFR